MSQTRLSTTIKSMWNLMCAATADGNFLRLYVKSIFFFSANTDKKVGGLLLLRGSTKIHLVFNMIAAKMMLPKILLWQPFCILLVQPCRQYLYDNYKSYHCKAESRCFYHSYYAWKVACFFQNSVPFLRVE